MNQKSKMVSFRLSVDEYVRLREACLAAGIQNVSELARAAMHRIIDDADGHHIVIDAQVQDLREKIANITDELNRISGKLTKTNGASA